MILSESCTGAVEAVTPDQARDRVRRYLAEFSDATKGSTLRDVLNLETLVRMSGWEEMSKRAINRVEADRFVVFKASRKWQRDWRRTLLDRAISETHIPETKCPNSTGSHLGRYCLHDLDGRSNTHADLPHWNLLHVSERLLLRDA